LRHEQSFPLYIIRRYIIKRGDEIAAHEQSR